MYKSLTPLQATRSTRTDRGRGVTTAKAGKIVPLRYIPLFREDQLINGKVSVTMELAETVRPLINAVFCEVQAWFVPFASFPRFADLGDFNRSYMKQADPKTGLVEPFFKTAAYGGNDLMRKLGIHMQASTQYNLAVVEAYNVMVNHQYNDRSPNLADRTALDTTLAACFWQANRLSAVVPNYDRNYYDGVVPVAGLSTEAPVRGIGIRTAALSTVVTAAGGSVTESTQAGANPGSNVRNHALSVAGNNAEVRIEVDQATKTPMLYVPINNGTANISLANIDLARKSAAFDALRTKYEGHDDDAIVELLMRGIRVPDYAERQPYLLASKVTQFNFGTRYATDGASLAKSVTNGIATVGLSLTMPVTNTGGIVLITGSVVPDQMFERRRDEFLSVVDQDKLPQVERDTLDVDKVDQVLNVDVDISHASPQGIFGYQPMNNRWNRDFVRLGGDLYRPSSATAYDEDRAVLWVTEPVNPVLGADWYLATNVNSDPFADRVRDHLTITVIHDASISGSTVFGAPLLEAPATV